jgi:uncharacterized protein (DUF924 family)
MALPIAASILARWSAVRLSGIAPVIFGVAVISQRPEAMFRAISSAWPRAAGRTARPVARRAIARIFDIQSSSVQ